ncbi:unnamed protein product [Rotaria sordida]|uniref:PiggyBac transposable element-derived protein domain-containing protein n=1 Tax=Rotaria sordida TaxID=392033 RepID=A0A815APX7_9BILA|nr:unnamed protein product [Rotaria sordida]CAF1269412.1 unnamed protein product [Rotaria sordida]CAF1304499.1 unnamed protein product [Rotaria sordida]CAF1542475.1 unnamed protein product [Rotaria sordida]
MTTKSNLKRIREIILTDNDNNNEFDDTVFEDDESNSDSDYSPSGTESDDTSTDECISKEDDSSDSHISDDDISTNTQPESVEKGGITWSIHNSKDHGRLRATSIMKKKPGAITAVYTIEDAFKLFFINDILDTIVLYTNNYARRYFDQQNQRRLNTDVHHSKLIK